MSLVSNERIKLTAGLLNTVAGFSITAGGIGPLIALTYGVNSTAGIPAWVLCLFVSIWIVAGVGLHLVARLMIGKLTS